jgi:hypothetical protein
MRKPEDKRFAVVLRRYHWDKAYAQWTDGASTAARWLAHAIRSTKDLERAYIVDHGDGAKQYTLDAFKKEFLFNR